MSIPALETDIRYQVGFHDFDVSIRIKTPDSVQLTLMVNMGGGDRLESEVLTSPDIFLAGLVDMWPQVAGHHCGNPQAQADIGILFGRKAGGIVMAWDEGLLRVLEDGKPGYRQRADSVIAVEVLETVGDLMAELSGDALRDRWNTVSAVSDMAPMAVMTNDMQDYRNGVEVEAAWYAGKIGVYPQVYISGAIATHARQILWATAGAVEPEMTFEDRDPRNWEPIERDVALKMARQASESLKNYKLEQLVGDAIASTNDDVRAEVVFGAGIWEKNSPKP